MQAEVVFNRLLTPQADKSIYLMRLSIPTPIDYRPGDWLMVSPKNPPALVEAVLRALGVSGDVCLHVRSAGQMPLAHALSDHLELSQVNPAVLNKLQRTLGTTERPRIWADRAEMMAYAQNKDILDVIALLQAHAWLPQPEAVATQADAASQALQLCQCLAPLSPRFYSIASAPEAVGATQVDVLYRQVVYTHAQRVRYGVTSHGLSASQPGDCLTVEHNPNTHFKLPEDLPEAVTAQALDTAKMPVPGEIPIVMIGAGTGLAPFLGFLQKRFAQNHLSPDHQAWLFIGERDAQTTDLVSECVPSSVLSAWQTQGLHLVKAYSQAVDDPAYVQDKVWAARDQIVALIDQGAWFYVCGSQENLAGAVESCLCQILQSQGQSPDQAAETWRHWRKSKRVQMDVY